MKQAAEQQGTRIVDSSLMLICLPREVTRGDTSAYVFTSRGSNEALVLHTRAESCLLRSLHLGNPTELSSTCAL
jgi:hypothetical protein